MGVVWLAEDVRLRRSVALKFLSADLAGSRRPVNRFLREAQAAAALDSPHVCTVYEADEHDGAPTWRWRLSRPEPRGAARRQTCPIDEALSLARQVAEGLGRSSGTCTETSPANIGAGDGTAKVTDFGLAHIEESGESTRTAGVAGTLAYMSPEQAQGLRTDARTDVWSLDACSTMLCGRAVLVESRQSRS
jgi:serine/threonine protein kinase